MTEKIVTRVAAALADPTRFRIFREIAARGEICCGDLAKKFPVSQATVSHHLRVLSESGLVKVRREGQFSFFRALPGAVASFQLALASFVPSAHRLRR